MTGIPVNFAKMISMASAKSSNRSKTSSRTKTGKAADAAKASNKDASTNASTQDEAVKPLSLQRLRQPKSFINRELSWLEFNRRVLEEALDPSMPLLERVKFLAIFSSNLDEFFMIRFSGLRRQLMTGVVAPPPDGMSPAAQLESIDDCLTPMLHLAAQCWKEDLLPSLGEQGIEILSYSQLRNKQRKLLRNYVTREIFPALTPLAFDPSHPFPHISNLSVNLAVVIRNPGQSEQHFARVKVPQIFPRLLRIPTEEKADKMEHRTLERLGAERSGAGQFVWVEEAIAANLDLLFPGVEVVDAFPFRVTRDADFEIEEDEASDLLSTMEEVVGQRHFGFAVRLEVDTRIPEEILDMLVRNLELAPHEAYRVERPIGKSDLMELAKIDRPDLKYAPFLPHMPPVFAGEGSIFDILRRRNALLYHPYDSFNPVVDFVTAAARDPKVLTIKQTLYRVGPDSPIVEALKEARENGKQVAALVELKARFDETNNIIWARELEQAGVHVVYGVLGLKTHAKMCLVVRRENEGTQSYVHVGTGNYNPVTARLYTDLGYLTADPTITNDVADLFNALTGYSRKENYDRLLVAPGSMRQEILRRIKREIQRHLDHGDGHIAFKLNSLVDKACIVALYQASQAGVKVDLQVRGICCLRPGVEGMSENITVTSIVGRFLEHSRIFYFRNGGDNEELFIGSADLMPRNLDGRVEVLVPIDDEAIRRAMRDDILFAHLEDTHCAQRLRSDGTYEHLRPEGGGGRNTQMEMVTNQHSWDAE